MPECALLRSSLQLRTSVRTWRLFLAKLARLCDIAPYSVVWLVVRRRAHARQLLLCRETITSGAIFFSKPLCSVVGTGGLAHQPSRPTQNSNKKGNNCKTCKVLQLFPDFLYCFTQFSLFRRFSADRRGKPDLPPSRHPAGFPPGH